MQRLPLPQALAQISYDNAREVLRRAALELGWVRDGAAEG